MQSIGKAELAKRVSTAAVALYAIHPKEVALVIDLLLAEIESTTTLGAAVQLKGFGTFKPKHQKARLGRNPRTGEAVEIPERTVLSFTASKHRE